MSWRISAQLVHLKPLSNLGVIAIVSISLSCETANKKNLELKNVQSTLASAGTTQSHFLYHVATTLHWLFQKIMRQKVCDDCKELRKQSKDWPHLCLKHWKLNVWLTSPVSSGFRDKTSKSKSPSLVSHLVILLRKQKCL